MMGVGNTYARRAEAGAANVSRILTARARTQAPAPRTQQPASQCQYLALLVANSLARELRLAAIKAVTRPSPRVPLDCHQGCHQDYHQADTKLLPPDHNHQAVTTRLLPPGCYHQAAIRLPSRLPLDCHQECYWTAIKAATRMVATLLV